MSASQDRCAASDPRPPYERPCTVTLADDGVVTVTRPDGLTVIVAPVEPPIMLDVSE